MAILLRVHRGLVTLEPGVMDSPGVLGKKVNLRTWGAAIKVGRRIECIGVRV